MTAAAAAAMPGGAGRVEAAATGRGTVLRCSGRWTVATAPALDGALHRIVAGRPAAPVTLDLSGVTALDTVGAWLVHRTRDDLGSAGVEARVTGATPERAVLIEAVDRVQREVPVAHPPRHKLLEMAEHVGRTTYRLRDEAVDLIGFLGMLVVRSLGALAHPTRIRGRAVAYHIEQTGVNALPIVGLLSFLIGVVLAYQGVDQLRQFGAEILVVNLLGIIVLRELGILLTAIIIAGRSGSAFTAQIGTMKVNLEVDAMQTLGLDPVDILVLPRIIALSITLPILSFYASMMAIFGGAMMAYFDLGIGFDQFLGQFRRVIGVEQFWVGIVKAPVFAFTIALVGCYEGLKVSGSAESVGRLTTTSVVVSIFLVIVLDALFSILFSAMGV